MWPIFEKFIKKNKRSRLRRIIRGYRQLKQSGRIDLIAKVKEALTEQEFGLSTKDFSSYMMGAGCWYGEIVVRQYLLIRIGGLGLNQALLYALGKPTGKVVYPLPKEWRVTITKYGFDVANIRSRLLWYIYILGAWLYGILQIAKIIFSGFKLLTQKPKKSKKYVYFANLSSGNLPHEVHGQRSYDIVSWYLQWKGKIKNIGAIHHSVSNVPTKLINDIDLVFQQDILPSLSGLKVIFCYVFWGFIASSIALLDFFRGRWWHALLLNQAALAAQVRILPKDSLAQEYLFHNSSWIYRPLWTYEAERRGSGILFYFYSTNCEAFKKQDSYPPISFGYKAMSWSRYLVWDEYQEDFVRRAVNEQANVSIVGPIWFQSSAIVMPPLDRSSVAVFDVTPHRHSRYVTLGLDNEFYTPTVTNPFLEHILNTTRQYDFDMLWKMKRNIGGIAHPFYCHLADQLVNNKHVMLVDPEISTIRVIESSVAVISMPFTSTALIAKEMGKPSIYYDPSGMLQKDDRAAHGIQVISEIGELENWLKTIKSVNKEQ